MSEGYGVLYLVATPIGNLEDITYRAVRILSEVDVIAAEDTRHTIKLLNHLGIKKPLISYHDNNMLSRASELISRLKEGQNIAQVSDAGMPAISDPGEELVKLCVDEGICVTAVPGCSAAITGLVLSGLSTERFTFEGFLPQKRGERVKRLKELIREDRTMIFYEGPHRVREMLDDSFEVFGERGCALARELTKLHEEIIRGSLSEMRVHFEKQDPRGEFVVIIAGAVKNTPEEDHELLEMSMEEHVLYYRNLGIERMEAIKRAAKDRGMSKRDVYQALNKD